MWSLLRRALGTSDRNQTILELHRDFQMDKWLPMPPSSITPRSPMLSATALRDRNYSGASLISPRLENSVGGLWLTLASKTGAKRCACW